MVEWKQYIVSISVTIKCPTTWLKLSDTELTEKLQESYCNYLKNRLPKEIDFFRKVYHKSVKQQVGDFYCCENDC